MWLKEKEFTIRLGGCLFIDQPILIAFQDEPLFGVVRHEDGQLGIDFEVFDAGRNKLATVKRNQIYSTHKDRFKLEGSADQISMIDVSSGDVLVDIKKRVAAAPAELDVSVRTYLPDGRQMILGPQFSNIAGIFLAGNTFKSNRGAGVNIR
jgi:hypothetical protein